eukprot:TRINITY_DN23969_c0_g1_i1.p3 TRINITY_DN23969_c0_g1~~TRINITY_DN23969_c0_g1_i1.p3  ORF type:complete len:208 (+),score=-22.99 TRINITY_DN23969_c0_g1_i1:478-1101(+)
MKCIQLGIQYIYTYYYFYTYNMLHIIIQIVHSTFSNISPHLVFFFCFTPKIVYHYKRSIFTTFQQLPTQQNQIIYIINMYIQDQHNLIQSITNLLYLLNYITNLIQICIYLQHTTQILPHLRNSHFSTFSNYFSTYYLWQYFSPFFYLFNLTIYQYKRSIFFFLIEHFCYYIKQLILETFVIFCYIGGLYNLDKIQKNEQLQPYRVS